MKTKEELAKEYSEEKYESCNEKELFTDGFIKGWDTAIKNQWTIPDCRDNAPDPKIVLKKGIIALLSNGRVIYQKDMTGFYWMPEEKKLVNYYSDVVAWMYAPSVDEFKK